MVLAITPCASLLQHWGGSLGKIRAALPLSRAARPEELTWRVILGLLGTPATHRSCASRDAQKPDLYQFDERTEMQVVSAVGFLRPRPRITRDEGGRAVVPEGRPRWADVQGESGFRQTPGPRLRLWQCRPCARHSSKRSPSSSVRLDKRFEGPFRGPFGGPFGITGCPRCVHAGMYHAEGTRFLPMCLRRSVRAAA